MTAQQALLPITWFRYVDEVFLTLKDIEVLEDLLRIIRDNNTIIPGSDMTYHQMYVHWTYHLLPDYKQKIKDCK